MLNYLLAQTDQLTGELTGNEGDIVGTPHLQWSCLPESLGWFAFFGIVLAIGVAVFWMYRNEMKSCPIPVKILMGVLRFTVLMLLVMMFLRPSVYYQQISEIKPVITVLRDSSLSFARGDTYRDEQMAARLATKTGLPADQIQRGEVDRSSLLVNAMNREEDWLAKVRDKGSIRIFDFSNASEYVGWIPATGRDDSRLEENSRSDEHESIEEGNSDSVVPGADDANGPDENAGDQRPASDLMDTMPPLNADGSGTDIWQALKKTLDNPGRVSAIVIASDFQHNGSENPVEIARMAESRGIPIFTIGVGDPNPPKNLKVSEIYVREKTYPDEPFEVEAILQSTRRGESGLPSEITVELVEHDVDPRDGSVGEGQVIQTNDQVAVPENGGRIRVDFGHTHPNPGRFVYTIRTPALEGETEINDNLKMSSELQVVDEQVKVLLISGEPSWDYQQVQRLLQRDQTISLSCWLQSMDQTRPQEGNAPISRLPRSYEEMREYNVIMMFDPNPTEFDHEWLDHLEEYTRKAGGLLYVAGPQHSAEFLTMNRLKLMRKLLPVRFGDSDFIISTRALADANTPGAVKMMPVAHNMDHPVMSFRSDPGETMKVWAMMPGVFWSFPTVDPRPTARTLIEVPDPNREDTKNQPLMVTGRFGSGSVMYVGFQGTWRWRALGLQAQYFDRYWIQVVRYLVETRSLQGSRRGFIDVDRTEYEIGDRIVLVGRVLNQEFALSNEESYKAKITTDQGRTETINMKRIPGQSGQYEGTFAATRIGNYSATVELAGDADQQESLIEPVQFRVVPPRAESNAFWLNERLMNEIADQSGGKAFKLDELEQLPEALPRIIKRAEFNSPPKPLWDMKFKRKLLGFEIEFNLRYLAFLLPVVLLTVEWALRKYYKLM